MMSLNVFSEGTQHFRFLIPILRKFKSNFDIQINVFSLDKNDYLKKEVIVDNFYLLNKNNYKYQLASIEGDFLITTTPGVGTSSFPKSKIIPKSNRPKYIYCFHSLVSPNEIYSKDSFKNFDSILSPNQLISKQLRFLVSSNVKIYEFGYPVLENFVKSDIYEKKSILIAPSWGKDNLFTNVNHISKIINFFNEKDFEVTLRPHPMFEMKNLNRFKTYVDKNLDLPSLSKYQFLMTDWSGIAIEYSYLTNRPVFFYNSPKKIRRNIKSNKERGLRLIENEMRTELGVVFNEPEELYRLDFDNINLNSEKANNFLNNIVKNEIDYTCLSKIINADV